MVGVWSAWAVACAFAAWNNGLKDGSWPPPYSFLDPTILYGGLSLFGHVNPRMAGLLAWGLTIPMVLIELQQWSKGGGPLASLPFANTTQTPATVLANNTPQGG